MNGSIVGFWLVVKWLLMARGTIMISIKVKYPYRENSPQGYQVNRMYYLFPRKSNQETHSSLYAPEGLLGKKIPAVLYHCRY